MFLLSRIREGSSRLMITQYQDLIHWTCFSPLTAADCCNDIEAAAIRVGFLNSCDCGRLVAEVPNVPMLRDYDMAKYSLVIHNTSSEIVSESILQHRYEDKKWKKQSSPTSPFFWSDMKKMDQPIKLRSVLFQEGGMHRHMTSTSEHAEGFGSYFLVMTVPESMFVDLDDFLADSNSIMHAATVCDIEKPAFVSGQHVIVVEVHNDSTLMQRTKWHIRYPEPSQDGVALIRNLPEPYGVFVKDGFLYYYQDFAKLPDVLVSTGYEQDCDLVLWGTMIACWVGVWKVLRGISSISYWDP